MLAHLIAFITAVALCSGSALSQDHDVFRTIAQAYRAGDDDRCVRLTQYALYDKPDSSHIYYYINISSNYRIGNYDGCAAYASYIVPQDSFYLASRMIAHSIAAREPGTVSAQLIDTITHDLRSAVVRRDSVAVMEALMMAHNHSAQHAGALPIALAIVELDVLSTPAWLYLVRKGVTGYDAELRDVLFRTVDTLQADPTDPGLRPVMMYCALISAIASDNVERAMRYATELYKHCSKPSSDFPKLLKTMPKLTRSQRSTLIANAVAGSPGVARWIHFAGMPRAPRFRF